MEKYGEILVTPEHLRKKAAEWKKVLEGTKEALAGIETASEATAEGFKGRAGERIRKRIKSSRIKGDILLKDLFGFAEELETIALEYEKAERRNQDVYPGN